jgi:carbamoyl-phosphate synthase/aspartate carbamoyltransferase/dihydroorotase
MNTILSLTSGQVFKGKPFGSNIQISGEVVFQTGMVGYPESFTDPSYKNQILVLTYPLVGNYGIPDNEVDEYGLLKYFESDKIQISGVIIAEYDGIYNHWNGKKSLDTWLKEHNVPGLYGVDTRELTKLIRDHGTVRGTIRPSVLTNSTLQTGVVTPTRNNLVDLASTKKIQTWNEGADLTVLIIDCGIKYNQIRAFLRRGVCVKLMPWDYDFTTLEFDKIFISNGPGNPEDCMLLVNRLRDYMNDHDTPIFGICLGHQILSLAAGAKTRKMKYGNRGQNIPCRLSNTQKCYITTQNHGYVVDKTTLPEEWGELFVNANDGTNEGIYHKSKPYFSVQFHPEAKGGPNDTSFLFDLFLKNNFRTLIDNTLVSNTEPTRALSNKKKVLILGSGGLSIGQSGEFDYSGSQAIKAYNEENITTILINPNIATIQTSPGFADKIYYLPVTPEYVTKIIKIERPDCITLSFGGQTALNCGIEIRDVLKKYNVEILGTPIESVIDTEDRARFNQRLKEINERIPDGIVITKKSEGCHAAHKIGYPVLVRAAYALGGLGSGFANNDEELVTLLQVAFSYSNQVIIDKSFKGWKEVEYEMVRDRFDNCISVCNMENFDPLGIHTGESIVIAPSQTLSDEEYNMLRDVAIKTVKKLKIVGECNIQYALDPNSKKYYIIEVNARLSRSSALASKATGYPLAYIAAKLSLGYSLLELKNQITGTTACFEPSLDYVVIKIPKWDLEKFPLVSTKLDSSMKSIGEVMAISRNFEEALQKALRMANDNMDGFQTDVIGCSEEELMNPTNNRIFAIANGLYNGMTVNRVSELTNIDLWFIQKLEKIVKLQKVLETKNPSMLVSETPSGDDNLLVKAKKMGFSDIQIGKFTKTTEMAIRILRNKNNIYPFVKQIDTVAGEFPCYTNYLYTTYNAQYHDIKFNDSEAHTTLVETNQAQRALGTSGGEGSIIVLGSGVYKIGSSVEFDWCCVNCIRTLRKLGKKTIMINCNPETVSTDYDEADKLYFDELSLESVLNIYQLENVEGVILAMGGQQPNNIAMSLYRSGVNIIGTSPEMIDNAENRYKFSRTLAEIGVNQPSWKRLTSIIGAKKFCQKVGYPCLIRPSYVLSGAAMNVAYTDQDLEQYLGDAVSVSKDYPIVISKFILDAKEIEVDAVAANGEVKLIAISEHVENAGIHSGDATLILPAQDVTRETRLKIEDSVRKIAQVLNINGPFNIQFIAKDDEVKVIECNLRVSRTFPFVSKTLDINFIDIATRAMLKHDIPTQNPHNSQNSIIGVKVPMFSFHRLKNADVRLGVEMVSTGEVACFGRNHYEAYIKALQASGFTFPHRNVLLSIGSFKFKEEFLPSTRLLQEMGFKLYGTSGTADYYSEQGIDIEELSLHESDKKTLINHLVDGDIDMVIDISKKNKINSRFIQNKSDGYIIRRAAIDSKTPLMTNIKIAKLFTKSLQHYINSNRSLYVDTNIDCFTSYKTIKLPGLIDVHVHIREPGPTYKGDWETETKAALAGGITCVCCMPNTTPPITDQKSFDLISKLANDKACCDYAIYVGANSDNAGSVHKLSKDAFSLKMYLNTTYGPLLLKSTLDWMEHVENWPEDRPIVVHAEAQTLPAILHITSLYGKRLHVAHVARKEEMEIIKKSKEMGVHVTCEVAPHHLFLSTDDLDKLGCCGCVKPNLMTKEDQQSLWDNMDIIDCFATDHAPHTLEDKTAHKSPGFPGLETALPLLLTAVRDGRLTLDDIVEKYHTNPMKIFNIPEQPETYIEVDLDKEWIIPDKMKYSKCQWTPFAGMKVYGMVRRVILRGRVVYVDGDVLAKPGFGCDLRKICELPISAQPTYKMTASRKTMDESVNEIIMDRHLLDEVKLPLKHILSASQFNRNSLRLIFNKGNEMKQLIKDNDPNLINRLSNKIMSCVFYEPSTRTRCSFTAAMQRLGGKVITISEGESSVKKGESTNDFLKTMEIYSDVVVMRTPVPEDPLRVAKLLNKPLINAGDGVNEHPTQALLDVYTIREEHGTVNGLTITIVGDLKNGRTVHSLVRLLSLYNDVRLRYVSPESLKLPRELYDMINEKHIEQIEYTDLDLDVLGNTDVLYVTRVQRERFSSVEEYNKVKDSYVITPTLLNKTKTNLVIMHPLPRANEISKDVDGDPRAAYFRQMENGLYVRMALLDMLLG